MRLYQKNLFIAIAAIIVVAGVWYAQSRPAEPIPAQTHTPQTAEATPQPAPEDASSTPPVLPEATTTPDIQPKPAEPPRIELSGQTDFHYDIENGKTPCGDHIGTVNIVSSDPSQELSWGFTGAKPIWLTFSQVEGKTPAKVDMTFNCVLSGSGNAIDWRFTVVEKTKEGKWVDGYYRAFTLKGSIKQ